MKFIEYYQYMCWDGADLHTPKEPFFLFEEDVKLFLGEESYDYFEKITIPVYESFSEWEQSQKEKLKKQALAKLTLHEKKALGLL